MKTGIAIGFMGVVAATMCSTGMAQDNQAQTPQAQTPQAQTPQAQTPQAQTPREAIQELQGLKSGEFQIDVSRTKEGVLLDINANDADVAALLRAVAQKANLKILVSDDVRGKIKGKWSQFQPLHVMRFISLFSDLELGKVGDTYLVVRGTARERIVVPRETRDLLPAPAPRFNLGQNQSQPPRNWGAFPFNGDRVFIVPTHDLKHQHDKNQHDKAIAAKKLETKKDETTANGETTTPTK